MKNILTPPTNLEEFANGYSNFDGIEPDDAEEALKTGKFFISHPAWDHHGTMWFADGEFHEAVKQYRTHVGTISADSLHALFEAVNDSFGYE